MFGLETLEVGESGYIVQIDRTHPMRKRLLELGFVRGARVQIVRRAPLGDPLEVVSNGTHLALRRKDLAGIWVEK